MQAQGDNSAKAGSKAIREILDEVPLRAASFIVTIYGDVVEPRGGAIWIGNLIEICAGVGISETLVRTAVSRLVAAGRLAGEREGRRSFYRLTDAARTEFAGAARVIFGLPEEASWQFVQLMGSSAEDRMLMLERSGHARLSPRLAIGVRPFPTAIMPALVFRAEIAEGAEELKAFASASWDLAPHAEAYRRFLGSFQSLAAPADAGSMTPADCLTARLLLVHQFRFVALRDPRLPAETLPEGWPGDEARRLFARLYLNLSHPADLHAAQHFVAASGPLAASTGATEERFRMLRREGVPASGCKSV